MTTIVPFNWHDGREKDIKDGDIDPETDALEWILLGDSYSPSTADLETSDLSDELAGDDYERVELQNVSVEWVTENEFRITADDAVWSGDLGDAPAYAVLATKVNGEVLGHLPMVDYTSGSAVGDLTSGTLKTQLSATAPTDPPSTDWGASTVFEAMGLSPSTGGASSVTRVQNFETATGLSEARALVAFTHAGLTTTNMQLHINTFNNHTNPNFSTEQGKGLDYLTRIFTLAPFPRNPNGTSQNDYSQVQTALAGGFDGYFEELGAVAHANGIDGARFENGRPKTVFRWMWESNGLWYPWWINTYPADFAALYDRIAARMEAGGCTIENVAFEWNLNTRGTNPPVSRASVRAAKPDCVEILGVDLYDNDWSNHYQTHAPDPSNPSRPDTRSDYWATVWAGRAGNQNTSLDSIVGLWWLLEFAVESDLMFSLTEWGPLNYDTTKTTQKGGGDNTYFIEKVHEFLVAACATGRLAYHCLSDYNDPGGLWVGRIDNAAFANAETKFLELFVEGV